MTNERGVFVSPLRRRFLSLLGIGCVAGTSLWFKKEAEAKQTLAQRAAQSIAQPVDGSPQNFIERAFDMRQLATNHGDQAYGAVVTINDRIIGQSWSRVILDNDPTGHAEMSALRDASRRTGRLNLSGATLYSTSHPCSMCEAAADWVGIVSMIHGRSLENAGPPRSCSRG